MSRTIKEVPQCQHNKDRMRRAKSWLNRSKKAERDSVKVKMKKNQADFYYEQFIFLWIAFNAAYGQDLRKSGERKQFLIEIMKRDYDNIIYKSIEKMRERPRDPINSLIGNKYIFRPFWEYARGCMEKQKWLDLFDKSRIGFEKNYRVKKDRQAREAILVEIFERLYELRNQVFHGGTTFATGWGRDQIEDGSRILAVLVPKIITVMQNQIDNDPASEIWGETDYSHINFRADNRPLGTMSS